MFATCNSRKCFILYANENPPPPPLFFQIKCSNPQCAGSVSDCSPSEVSHYLAGIDHRLESDELYPGVKEIAIGIGLGPNFDYGDSLKKLKKEEKVVDTGVPLRTILLSARPREAGSLASISQSSEIPVQFEETGSKWGFSSWGVNLDDSMVSFCVGIGIGIGIGDSVHLASRAIL